MGCSKYSRSMRSLRVYRIRSNGWRSHRRTHIQDRNRSMWNLCYCRTCLLGTGFRRKNSPATDRIGRCPKFYKPYNCRLIQSRLCSGDRRARRPCHQKCLHSLIDNSHCRWCRIVSWECPARRSSTDWQKFPSKKCRRYGKCERGL